MQALLVSTACKLCTLPPQSAATLMAASPRHVLAAACSSGYSQLRGQACTGGELQASWAMAWGCALPQPEAMACLDGAGSGGRHDMDATAICHCNMQHALPGGHAHLAGCTGGAATPDQR